MDCTTLKLSQDEFGRLFVNKDWWVVQNQIRVRMNHILAQIFCYLTLINWLIKKILILMFSNDLNP